MSFQTTNKDRLSTFKQRDDNRRVAIIDIGSNSVRLVIYDVVGRCIRTFFNEKVLAGLGRGLGETGKLDPDGRVLAMQALDRFCAVMDAQRVTDVTAFATAAVRDAEDGAEFCAKMKERTGLAIRILSGTDEAKYAASGVIAMQPKADGVCGDLGGSSLEFSNIQEGYYTGGSTYALGPLALQSVSETIDLSSTKVRKALEEHIDSVLDDAIELKGRSGTFYAVGGAWRTIARIHMELNDYSLRMLQNYEMTASSVIELCDRLMVPDKKLTPLVTAIAKKREQTLPLTALVLSRLIQIGGFDKVVTSSYGAREGMVYEGLSASLQRRDPLLAGMRLLMKSEPAGELFGEALAGWIRQASEKTLPQRLIEASCIVADLGARLHPDHRSHLTSEWVLTAPVTGVTHVERAMLALAIGCRYERNFRSTATETLLNGSERAAAKALGALMRLGADFSGRTANLFAFAKLTATSEELVLDVDKDHSSLASELVIKRLERTAFALGLTPALKFGGEQSVAT
ncbi:MAG: phosphatase [Hirschia sp.]|nr:phosphatase [Hirschia sp.]MBF18119.1 phosphatase [Hirschia sp.]